MSREKVILGEHSIFDKNTGINDNILVCGSSGERVIIVIPHGSAVNTRASAA